MDVVALAAAAALRSLVTVLGHVPRVVDIPTQLAWSRRRAQVRIERERKIRSGGQKKQDSATAKRRRGEGGAAAEDQTSPEQGHAKRRRSELLPAKAEIADGQVKQDAADTVCPFLQQVVNTRAGHIKQLRARVTVSVIMLARQLEKMEQDQDGVQRSGDEQEERLNELKAEGRDALIRKYVDKVHGDTSILSDAHERKELRKLELLEEDELLEGVDDEDGMVGQELFPAELGLPVVDASSIPRVGPCK